jgi:hypothetical protein
LKTLSIASFLSSPARALFSKISQEGSIVSFSAKNFLKLLYQTSSAKNPSLSTIVTFLGSSSPGVTTLDFSFVAVSSSTQSNIPLKAFFFKFWPL